ncbi:MAG: hypothetical protein J3K34DRAFT_131923 [Monoraphidium minutum]|nr:MAG: hypothetical protein J3K34DRAFT_131923 [Monoraphidium minutum]
MSLLQLLLRPAERSLIDVLTKLPNLGIGARVAKRKWLQHGDSWWEVTDVKLKGDDAAHGRVWGVLYWRNQRVHDKPTRVPGAAKREWRWLAPEAERARLEPLAAELRGVERARRAAAVAAAGGGGGGTKE